MTAMEQRTQDARAPDTIRLDGQVAIVTGAGRGLGQSFATALAGAGAAVVVNDVDGDAARQTVDAIEAAGGRAIFVKVAVGSSEAADLLVEAAVDSFGRLDLLCANAGILRDRVLWNLSDDDFDSVIHTHLRGTFTCARAAVRQMRAQGNGGSVALVSSIAGQRGNFGQTAYSAAKAGIAAYARTWSMECAKAGISVNAIVPVAYTHMVATIPSLAPYAEVVSRGEPLPAHLRQGLGLGLAEEVAPLLVFLASQRAREITGQCLGLGGDKLSLWSHPKESRVAIREGGWTAESIALAWDSHMSQAVESVG